MLFPTHTASVSRQGASSAYASSRQVKFHTPHIDADIQVQPAGQPLHAFLEDKNVPPLAWSRGDIVTILTTLADGLPYQGNVTKWTVDSWGKRGDLWPYYEVQLTSIGR